MPEIHDIRIEILYGQVAELHLQESKMEDSKERDAILEQIHELNEKISTWKKARLEEIQIAIAEGKQCICGGSVIGLMDEEGKDYKGCEKCGRKRK